MSSDVRLDVSQLRTASNAVEQMKIDKKLTRANEIIESQANAGRKGCYLKYNDHVLSALKQNVGLHVEPRWIKGTVTLENPCGCDIDTTKKAPAIYVSWNTPSNPSRWSSLYNSLFYHRVPDCYQLCDFEKFSWFEKINRA